MFEVIMSVIKSYMGTGFVTVVFLLCLAYLAFTEQDKVKRCVFIYMPIVVIVVFLCPLTYMFYGKVSEAVTYYRLLWLIPVTPVIAYASVLFLSSIKSGKKKTIASIALTLFLAFSGKLMYTSVHMVDAENMYHMPQVVVDICDAIHVDGREVRAAMPEELMQFVRQYDPCICLAYGRQYLMGIYAEANDFRDAMIARDPEQIGTIGTMREVHYIIVRPGEEFEEIPVNYEEYMRIDGFIIYKNTVVSTSV